MSANLVPQFVFGRGGVRVDVLSRVVSGNLRAARGQFASGAVSAARYAHFEMARVVGKEMRAILDEEVKARRARFASLGPDFNRQRRRDSDISLRAALTSEAMWTSGTFGFTYDTDYLNRHPVLRTYWKRVNDGVAGQSFPLLVFRGGRARTATRMLREGGSGRARLVQATYTAPGYQFMERGARNAQAKLVKGGRALELYKFWFKKADLPFDGRLRSPLPSGIGAGPSRATSAINPTLL